MKSEMYEIKIEKCEIKSEIYEMKLLIYEIKLWNRKQKYEMHCKYNIILCLDYLSVIMIGRIGNRPTLTNNI